MKILIKLRFLEFLSHKVHKIQKQQLRGVLQKWSFDNKTSSEVQLFCKYGQNSLKIVLNEFMLVHFWLQVSILNLDQNPVQLLSIVLVHLESIQFVKLQQDTIQPISCELQSQQSSVEFVCIMTGQLNRTSKKSYQL